MGDLTQIKNAGATSGQFRSQRAQTGDFRSGEHMTKHILISGCSGGGKSTLLAELKAMGHPVVEEPGRRVVEQERATGGTALPWTDMVGFVRKTLALSRADLDAVRNVQGHVFFDRGLIDAAAALAHYAGVPLVHSLGDTSPYIKTVFLAPPWPEIYETDADRKHGFDDAVAEYHRLLDVFRRLGHDTLCLPKCAPRARAEFILSHLA